MRFAKYSNYKATLGNVKKVNQSSERKGSEEYKKYTKVAENNETIKTEKRIDIVAPISTERDMELKEVTPAQKRKRSHGYSPNSTEGSKPTKCINMSKSPEDKNTITNLTSDTQDNDLDEDETTLSPELAKLERILSRKQTSSLEGIKRDIKLLLEMEELIKKQQDTIEELKKENYELNVKCNRLEKKETRLKKCVSDIENELYSSNVILHGISESEYEEGPERYRLVTEVIATTIYAGSYEEQIQIARKIPIKKTYRIGRYNSQRGRPIVVNFVYHEDFDNLLSNKKYLPRGVFADGQYSQDTEDKRRILRPIYITAINHHLYKGKCKMEGEYIKIQGRR